MYFSTMPAYTKICNLMGEMDNPPLQNPYSLEDSGQLMDTYTEDCRNAQSNIEIDDLLFEYSSSDSEQSSPKMNQYNQQPINTQNAFHTMQSPVSTTGAWTFPTNDNTQINSNPYETQQTNMFNNFSPNSAEDDRKCNTDTCNPNFMNKQFEPFHRNVNPELVLRQYQCQQQQRHLQQQQQLPRVDRKHSDSDPDHMQWTRKHPENWNSKEVLDWLFFTAEKHQVDCGVLHAENFRSLPGSELCKMGLEDFLHLDNTFGRLLYDLFRNLCDGFIVKTLTESKRCDTTEDTCTSPESMSPPQGCMSPPHMYPIDRDARPYDSLSDYPMPADRMKQDNKDNVFYDINHQHPAYSCSRLPMSHPMPPCPLHYQRPPMPPYGLFNQQSQFPPFCPPMTSSCDHGKLMPPDVPRRRPGRPRVKSMPTEDELNDKKVKNQHLWEFIYEILMNPAFNPQFLRWENEREGVFRFVQSEAVAQLWGRLKNNENMTYEKLSRAMRHYYKRGILERVEGRRLVYKFTNVAMQRAREKRYSI